MDVARAAAILRDGGTVAFPTETVYGLGANALSAIAVEQIFVAKQRPHWDPLIVHVADRAMVEVVARYDELESRLMDLFWPGPLTLLLPRTEMVPDAVTAGRARVGVRFPGHPVARDLIRAAGVPVAAPSANRFGHTSPTTAAHVLDDLDGRIAAVLDGGATSVGVESTVVEVGEEGVVVYRPGAVTLEMLRSVSGVRQVTRYVAPERAGEPESLPSPGVGMRHYAPRAEMVLVEVSSPEVEKLSARVLAAGGNGRRVGVMLPEGWRSGSAELIYQWGGWDRPEMLAQRLFAGLRALDEAGAEVIFCPVPAGDGIGAAIRDRLEKAARAK